MKLQTVERNSIKFTFSNQEEFETIYKDIFINNDYAFKSRVTDPTILDCGSHIGISVLYFKKIYPQSKITAFEPNPFTFKILEQNIKQNNIKGVTLINAGLSDKEQVAEFYISRDTEQPWSMNNSLVLNKGFYPETHQKINIATKILSHHINSKIDLLKLDVQGMEQSVLEEIEDKLAYIDHIILEYHGITHSPPNNAKTIFNLLEKHHLKIEVRQSGTVIDKKDVLSKDHHWVIIDAKKSA